MKFLKGENFEGQRVFLRGSLNAPLKDDKVADTYRLEMMLPTLKFLKKQGAKTILVGHRSGTSSDSLRAAHKWLSKKIPMEFVEDIFSEEGKKTVESMKDGDVVMLENIRMYLEEKANDPVFSKRLAEFADVYINDAFPVSHRKHASVVGLPKLLPSYAGLQFEAEYKNLSEALEPPRPALLLIGGAKFESKVPLALQFLDRVDYVFTGGAIAHVFLAAQGHPVGASKMPDETYDVEATLSREELLVPKDVVVQKGDGTSATRAIKDIKEDESIVDMGPKTLRHLKEVIKECEFVLWGGPLSFYEKGYVDGTREVVEALAKSNAKTIIGGGEVDAIISELGARDQFDFVSTAGGALLGFLSNGTLPGIEALEASGE